jgi:putative endonuclease
MKQYCVNIASNFTNSVLYTGVTSNLILRISQHKNKTISGFTSRYNVKKLVYFEVLPTALEAIAAEKKIKGWTRLKKIALICEHNPDFKDLSENL